MPSRPLALSIVVPIRDERESIPTLVAELERFRDAFGEPMEVILVDDGSRDGSWDIIRDRAIGRSWIRAIRFRAGRGQTAAMTAGIQASRGEYLTFLDADLQSDPADILPLLNKVRSGEADVACGWRRHRKDNPLLRTLPSVLANWLIRVVLHLKIHDLGCTMKVFRREYIESVNMIGEMHRFLAAYAQAQGARLVEMEVNHRPRVHGESKYGLSRTGKVLMDLFTVVMLNSYGASPAYLFGKMAAFLFTLGTIAFGIVCYRVFALHRPQSTPMIFMMMLAYIAGLISLMSGLLAEINVRVLYQVGVFKTFDVRDRIGFGAGEEVSSSVCAGSSADSL